MTRHKGIKSILGLLPSRRKSPVFKLNRAQGKTRKLGNRDLTSTTASDFVKQFKQKKGVYRKIRNGRSAAQSLEVNQANLGTLNRRFNGLGPLEGLRQLYETYDPKDIMITTSFGTKSILLIHLIKQVHPEQVFYFVDTGFHFKETLAYKKKIEELYDVQIETVYPANAPHDLTAEEEWWKEHPKMCCAINKIAPLEPIIDKHKIWISSLMAFQTKHRSNMRVFEKQGDILKYQPLLNLTEAAFDKYLDELDLPLHPLAYVGYGSIGCMHCTTKGNGRNGRWADKAKTECGLHIKYYNKK